MEYGKFTAGGSGYEVTTPLTPSPWKNCLYNDSYYLEMDQTLQGAGQTVQGYNRSRCFEDFRYFFLKDESTGEVWNPNYLPMASAAEHYSCTHNIWNTKLNASWNGLEAGIRVMIPVSGTREIWTISLRNQSSQPRRLTFYPVFGFYDHGVMGGECRYEADAQAIVKYAFPYHVFYEEKEKVEHNLAYAYLFADRTPDGWEMSKSRFWGCQPTCLVPEAVQKGRLSGIKAEAEEFCGAFQFHLALDPGEEFIVSLEAGAAAGLQEIFARKKQFSPAYVQREAAALRAHWNREFENFQMETPDQNLNFFANYWLKKQVVLLTRQNRGSTYCPTRNQLQDAMGYAIIQPQRAQKYILDILALQHRDGFLPQWHDEAQGPHGLCHLHHTDGPIWLAICAEAWVRQTGDKALLNRQVPYADGGNGTILEHIEAALLYLANHVGAHGMCLIGDGDWNDPINGAGREGRGESVWLSMALVYAIRQLLPYLAGRASHSSLKCTAKALREAINTYAWCGTWYAAALHDDGRPLGDKDDRLFLNTQSWAILSDVADANQKRLIQDALKQLETPFGPLILSPSFHGWDARWGRISIKQQGTTENGSVYCHASMFLAYAWAQLREGEQLYDTLWRTLPTNPENPPEKNGQLPIYLANYYFGLRDSENFGRSSRHYGTGTTAWMLMLMAEELCGAKATTEGLLLQPCIPQAWDRISCSRNYREAAYHITVRRGEAQAVYVNGERQESCLLPYAAGNVYEVEMILPTEERNKV